MTASANGKATPESATTFVADTVKTTNAQVITAMKQTTTMTMDVASSILASLGKLTSSLPTMPTMPFMPTKTAIAQLVNVGFDTSENMLSMQRGLATEMVDRFVPAGGAR